VRAFSRRLIEAGHDPFNPATFQTAPSARKRSAGVFCFEKPEDALTFAERFGGERLAAAGN
jgi:hypothetical protein